MRTFDELRGSFASLSRALKRSSAGTLMSSALAFSAARLAAYCATNFSRFALRLIWESFAILASVHKGELEALKKRLRLFVGLRRRVDDDVHAPHGFGLVVVDLDEHDVLFQAHREIAASVEALAVQSAKIAHAWQRHRHE